MEYIKFIREGFKDDLHKYLSKYWVKSEGPAKYEEIYPCKDTTFDDSLTIMAEDILKIFEVGYTTLYGSSEEVKKSTFEKDLEILINKYSMENDSNTPDFLLKDYLINCLDNFNSITNRCNKHNGGRK
jgi:hypothetical protein